MGGCGVILSSSAGGLSGPSPIGGDSVGIPTFEGDKISSFIVVCILN